MGSGGRSRRGVVMGEMVEGQVRCKWGSRVRRGGGVSMGGEY